VLKVPLNPNQSLVQRYLSGAPSVCPWRL